MSNEVREWIDANGKHIQTGNIKSLVEPSQKWINENPPIEPEPHPPTIEEQLAEKLALQEKVLEELMFIILPEITGGGI